MYISVYTYIYTHMIYMYMLINGGYDYRVTISYKKLRMVPGYGL